MTPAIQAAPQSPVVPASSAATPAAGSAEAQAAATEFDLDDPASAKSYLLLYWSTQKSKDAAEVYIDYYIQTAKAKATKAEPLSHIIQRCSRRTFSINRTVYRSLGSKLEEQSVHPLRAQTEVCRIKDLVRKQTSGFLNHRQTLH